MLSRNSLIKITKPLALIMALISINIFSANPANSATGYRYWGYFQAAPGATQWTAAMTGPSVEVKDGAVEGWTFVFSSNDVPAATPMMDPDFASLCGETPEAALIRELKEELGIDTWASCLAPLTFASHSYDGFHLLMPLFACRRWEGIVSGREGQNLAWVKAQNLKDYPMPPADIPLIPILRDWL